MEKHNKILRQIGRPALYNNEPIGGDLDQNSENMGLVVLVWNIETRQNPFKEEATP